MGHQPQTSPPLSGLLSFWSPNSWIDLVGSLRAEPLRFREVTLNHTRRGFWAALLVFQAAALGAMQRPLYAGLDLADRRRRIYGRAMLEDGTIVQGAGGATHGEFMTVLEARAKLLGWRV